MVRTDTLSGVVAIPVTPFTRTGDVDYDAFRSVIEFCLERGATSLAYPLIASEFYLLGDEERNSLAEVAISTVARAAPVVLGCSGVSAPHARSFARNAQRLKADAIVAMPPYSVRHQPEQIVSYYETIVRAFDGPLIIQNPGSAQSIGYSLEETTLEMILHKVSPYVPLYVKEERDPTPLHITRVKCTYGDQLSGIFGGRAGLSFLNELSRGAVGTMVAPAFIDHLVQVYDSFLLGNVPDARSKQDAVLPALLFETSRGHRAVKEALRLRGVALNGFVRDQRKGWDEESYSELLRILEEIEAD